MSTFSVTAAVAVAVVAETVGLFVVVPSAIPGWITDAVTVLDETEVAVEAAPAPSQVMLVNPHTRS